MSIVLVRVDDRLVHGQVVVGWVQALGATRIALVDDDVRANSWEQELYELGMPPGLALEFASVPEAAERVPEWRAAREKVIVLVGSVDAVVRLCHAAGGIDRVNVGGLHDATGRRQRLPYVYLSNEEAARLTGLAGNGVRVTVQDVPTVKPVPIEGLR
jgi:mannose/fructose/N-acetylgalactosamine-specific phosphotransferase system component IIB